MKAQAVIIPICVVLIVACNPAATQPISTASASPAVASPTVRPTPAATSTRPAAATLTTSATPATVATSTLPPASTPTSSTLQKELKDEWRTVFTGSMILFAACELTYETHEKFKKGEINKTRALSDLDVESKFFTIVYRSFTTWADPSDAVAPFKAKLERDMDTYIQCWGRLNSGDVGSLEVTQPLLETCSSFFETQNSIVQSAMKAGMTPNTADELALEIEELLDDLYSMVRGDH